MTGVATEFLGARRARALDALGEVVMPAFRGTPGWEFTPIDDLDLDAFAPAGGAARARG